MRILDKYINTSIIKIFLGTIFVFCLIYILVDITSNLDNLLERKASAMTFIKYYANSVPIIFVETSAIACLIATLFTYTNLSNNNEVIVMRASGLNFWRIAKPAIFFSLIISIMVFWLNERFVPSATLMTKNIRDEKLVKKEETERKRNKIIYNLTFYGLKNRLYFISEYNPRTYALNGITIIEYDKKQQMKKKVVALTGIWTGIAWKFFQCQITSFDPKNPNKTIKIKVYREKLMDIKETPEDFLKQRVKVSSMNIRQLRSYISRFSDSGAVKALNNLRVDLHRKYSVPAGNFVIVLVGLPFVLMIRGRKTSTFSSIGIAILIAFLYYVTNAVTLAFGKGGLLPPLLCAWLTPFIFISVALILIEYYF